MATINKNNICPAVIERCKAGDRIAQQLVFDTFSARMFAVCMRYSSDVMEAEDILMIGFTNVFTKIDRYNGLGSFEGWIRSVMVNIALSNYRRKQRKISTVNLEEYFISNYSTGQNNRCEIDYLVRALQALPAHYRVAFNMHALEGYSHREISSVLNISETCSKAHVARARKMLQQRVTAGSGQLRQGVFAA
ncbi:MAG TPA: sigma-70 family RNA polymerase sigma factor [Pedobacter sp.]|nr:sigma-70 family RNA polymerase sigma factor [Pedobacter sp.]